MGKWVVLGKPECQWCEYVRGLMHVYGIEFVYMNVVGTELAQFLINNGLMTVPQVYHNGYHVGGYEELEKYLEALEEINGLAR